MVNAYYMSNGDVQLSPSFALSEFQCKNGNDEILVSDILVDMLEQLKARLHADAVIINSGYRTPDYSVYVGGGYGDAHTRGLAADIYAYRDGILIEGAEICINAQDIGFRGIGYMGSAVHLDVRGYEEYDNDFWWGDEQTGENVSDWYDYFYIQRPEDEPQAPPAEDGTFREVRTAYVAFLDRDADANGLESYKNDTFNDLIFPFINSIEFKNNFIRKCYQIYLGRDPENEECYTSRADKCLTDILEEIYNSEEAKDRR